MKMRGDHHQHDCLPQQQSKYGMINFPKRNVAQHIVVRPKQHTEIVVSQPELPESSESKPDLTCPGAIWNDKLYPSELWRMHDDLDKLVYGKLSEKEIEDIRERVYGSLKEAEAVADEKLFKFVQDSIDSIGIENYSDMLKKAITPNSQILLALRCYAAATSETRVRDIIEVYSNRSMNSIDFFPDSCKVNLDGEEYVVDRPEKVEDPYWRSQNHNSIKHRRIRKIITDPEQTEKDKMPPSMAEQMSNVLKGFGINIHTNIDAWNMLDARSKKSSVEDRIISRIAYLVMNATVHKSRIVENNRKLITGT